MPCPLREFAPKSPLRSPLFLELLVQTRTCSADCHTKPDSGPSHHHNIYTPQPQKTAGSRTSQPAPAVRGRQARQTRPDAPTPHPRGPPHPATLFRVATVPARHCSPPAVGGTAGPGTQEPLRTPSSRAAAAAATAAAAAAAAAAESN